MPKEDVHAEIGEIIIEQKPGQTSDDEIAICDATGTALQDVPAAADAYEKAVSAGEGESFNFFEVR